MSDNWAQVYSVNLLFDMMEINRWILSVHQNLQAVNFFILIESQPHFNKYLS